VWGGGEKEEKPTITITEPKRVYPFWFDLAKVRTSRAWSIWTRFCRVSDADVGFSWQCKHDAMAETEIWGLPKVWWTSFWGLTDCGHYRPINCRIVFVNVYSSFGFSEINLSSFWRAKLAPAKPRFYCKHRLLRSRSLFCHVTLLSKRDGTRKRAVRNGWKTSVDRIRFVVLLPRFSTLGSVRKRCIRAKDPSGQSLSLFP